MKNGLREYDVVAYLENEEEISLFWHALLEESPHDTAVLADGLVSVARARMINNIAAHVDIPRDTICRLVCAGETPSAEALMHLVPALGLPLGYDVHK